MPSAFSLQRNSTPLDFSKSSVELGDIFTKRIYEIGDDDKPIGFEGVIYHKHQKYTVARMPLGRGSTEMAHHFMRSTEFEHPWLCTIVNMYFAYVAQTRNGRRELEAVRQEFDTLLSERKKETQLTPLLTATDYVEKQDPVLFKPAKNDPALLGQFYKARIAFIACRNPQFSICPSKRLENAKFSGGNLQAGGFQQPFAWDFRTSDGSSLNYIFELKDGRKITFDHRTIDESLELKVLDNKISESRQRLSASGDLAADVVPSESCTIRADIEKMESTRNELMEKMKTEASDLVTLLYEQPRSGGWTFEQQRLFNAFVDESVMLAVGVDSAYTECPLAVRGRVVYSADELVARKNLIVAFGKSLKIDNSEQLVSNTEILAKGLALKKAFSDLINEKEGRKFIVEAVTADAQLTTGMASDQVASVINNFVRAPFYF